MERYEIDKLRALPIEGVADRLGLKVKKHKALCPFHADSHPSLSFHVGHNTYKCFVCDAHGGPIDLAMKLTGKSFIEACKWLADEHNVILTEWKPAEKPKKEFPPDVEYLNRLVQHPVLNTEAREFLFRDPKEHEAWLKRDPIVVVRKQLIDEGTCTEDEMVAMEAEVRKQVDEAVAFAHASAWPPVSEVYTDVYAD